jgi:hypothetical protein
VAALARLLEQGLNVFRVSDFVRGAGILVGRLVGDFVRLLVRGAGRPDHADDAHPRQQQHGRGPEQSVQRPVTTGHARHFDPFEMEEGGGGKSE